MLDIQWPLLQLPPSCEIIDASVNFLNPIWKLVGTFIFKWFFTIVPFFTFVLFNMIRSIFGHISHLNEKRSCFRIQFEQNSLAFATVCLMQLTRSIILLSSVSMLHLRIVLVSFDMPAGHSTHFFCTILKVNKSKFLYFYVIEVTFVQFDLSSSVLQLSAHRAPRFDKLLNAYLQDSHRCPLNQTYPLL